MTSPGQKLGGVWRDKRSRDSLKRSTSPAGRQLWRDTQGRSTGDGARGRFSMYMEFESRRSPRAAARLLRAQESTMQSLNRLTIEEKHAHAAIMAQPI